MRTPYRSALIWLAVLVGGALFVSWSFPRAFPFMPRDWSTSRAEAESIALAALDDLGELPADPYVVTSMQDDARLEYRMLERVAAGAGAEVRAGELPARVESWQVSVYPSGARPRDWRYRVQVSFSGRVLSLERGFQEGFTAPAIGEAEARARAEELLVARGIALDRYEAPTVRRRELDKRTDWFVRFPDRGRVLGDRIPYGLEVSFAGDQLGGYSFYVDDPDEEQINVALQPIGLYGNFAFFSTFLVLPLVAPFFLKRYHEGEIGVKRGLQIFGLCLLLGLLFFPLVSKGSTEGFNFGVLSRQQVTWVWGVQMFVLFAMPIAIASLLSWSVGESMCRERWGRKLAAFDALFQGEWRNRTVALSSLRGFAGGFALAAATLGAVLLATRWGAIAPFAFQLGPFWQHAALPGVALTLFLALFSIYTMLFGRLFLLPWLVRRLGLVAGAAVATLVTSFVFFAPAIVLPMSASIPIWIGYSAATVVFFLAADLLTAMIAHFTATAVLSCFPLALAADPSVQIQGWIGLLAGSVPLLLTARHLVSERVFVYRYEDVPPHVRRIAERERQRVELETARNIQSSILPALPDQLNGVELSHSYLPATEVGGDFYDVLALGDGRLAVAVGDVAGHGVSSGLVMSMAKSALAVQVTFDPEVSAVFGTLNRMVYQSARKRLLATLCYALLDPARREMKFASAGHLFPYRVSTEGRVEVLESVAYPLGVRPSLDVVPRMARLEPGDTVFLCSDGLIEARRQGTEELFGFDRLEAVLKRVAGNGASVVRDAVLRELESWMGDAPREDDLTLLVLRIP